MTLLDFRVRFGDDELVLNWNHGHVEANHGASLAGKVASRGDDVLAGDIALVGGDDPIA